MTRNNGGAEGARPLIIATILREEGTTGVQTHVRQLRRYLRDCGTEAELVTPFSWGGPVTKGEISHDGAVFRSIRRLERQVIPRADGLVYVSRWARNALLQWLPQAAYQLAIGPFRERYDPGQCAPGGRNVRCELGMPVEPRVA